MPYVRIADDTRLYYELLGPEDGPVILQLGGGLFGRHNFGSVNDGFIAEGFRLLPFDARGYGASDHPHEQFTIEGWADDAAALLDALELDRVYVHGTSMGGMIAIAFAARISTGRPCSVSGGAWPSRCPGTTSPTT
jgi:pimeloyl-ACP methyl ester carboxylesterase